MALVCALVAVAAGCDEAPDDRTPSGALLRFLEAMEQSTRDPRALEQAYHLLAPTTREALAARAARAESLAGREMHPWEMIVQDHFRMRVPLEGRRDLTERIDGARATVVVRDGKGEPMAEVPMVQEGDRWRVHLEIPPVAGQ
jgi:hypothetical protein